MKTNGAVDTAAIIKQIERQSVLKRLGWRTLDAVDFGLNAGELAIVAGRPGHGKTTVLMNTLVHWLEDYPDETFVLISHEVPVEAVVIKLLSILTRRLGRAGWSYNDLRAALQNKMNTAPEGLDAADVAAALAKLRELEGRLRVVYQPDWTVEDVDHYLKSVAGEGRKLGGVFVDYLQLIPGPPSLKYESRDHEISTAAKHLKRTAVEIGAPMMVAAQISRDVAWTVDYIPGSSLEDERVLREIIKRRPQLHHVGEGGGDQEADLVLGILNFRAELVSAAESEGVNPEQVVQSGDANPFEILVLKNRYGRLVTAPMIIELKSGYIRDQGVFGK
jgi:replicative DNA helicase